ncbi:xanthine dehydrogenase-like isoform X2 [Choristoneura fumiferana]
MDRVNFRVNGKPCSVGREVSSDVTLLDYLRVGSELRGSKYMCREGGCGACVVAAARAGDAPVAVNSCLVSVTSCEGWEVSTIEGVGSRHAGYHPLQKTLAKHNGTQCGYCSPGWVMAMYSLLQSKKKLTMLEIEQSFGSNICRCTGYRPILEAFKTFASDAPEPHDLLDIEDLNICKKNGKICLTSTCSESDWCLVEADDIPQNKEIELKDGRSWFRVLSVKEIFEVLGKNGDDSYMFVAGNTAKGAYPISEYPRVLIDISSVNELKGYHLDQNLVIGAALTLTETMDIFEHLSVTEADFWYLEKLRQHLLKVAHIPVRNIGTIGGNLMTKHQHFNFQSDVFLLLETVGACLTILDSSGSRKIFTPEAFLKLNMKGKIIFNILLPPLGQDYKFVSFKIMPRAQNAHAIVNAGYLYKLCSLQTTVLEARIVYGGLSAHFVHAENTEKFLIRKKLFTNETLQAALKVLEQELVVTENLPEPSVKYRKNLALNLFYKGLLSLCPGSLVGARYGSGGVTLSSTRPVSNARQIFTTNPTLYPINQPVPKAEALIQCAGEASYTEDLPRLPCEVYGAFVLATAPLGDIHSIDASDALQQPGVIDFYSAKDIPGVNSFIPRIDGYSFADEEVFCEGPVRYNGQVIGVIVAETRRIAENAAKRVLVKYSNIKKPVIDIKKAKKDANRTKMAGEKSGGSKGTEIYKIVKGDETIYQQTHFCMETLMCVTKPTEEGLEAYCATQWLDNTQAAISRVLKMPENKIDVHVRRLGGAYGLKLTRINQVAAACALVTHKLNRPCRIILPLATQSKSVGKRLPCSTEYEVAIDTKGVVQYCNEDMYMDNGYIVGDNATGGSLTMYNNCYDKARWNFKAYNVTTDTASNTHCRAPGTLEAITAAEFIMERVAYELALDPLEVRLRNLDPAYTELREMVERVKNDAQYADRRAAVDKYNAQNRWKKRGLRFSLLRWTPFGSQNIDVNLSVYHDDGTVAITHGAVEMGQGLNTKAIQIAAHVLNIPMEKIEIKGSNTINTPNGPPTGGSLTSNNVGLGVVRACEQLLSRMAPIRASMVDATWEEQVQAAYNANVDLQAHGFVSLADKQKTDVFGVTLAEVEVDVLTGEWELVRVDLLEDAGLSVSPQIDVGQVEGAFIMGLGYWTCEQLVFDPETGELLTDRTWNYHVPQARDIPQDFRVYFRNKSYSEPQYFGAKVIGEPPTCMSVAVPFAMREAIVAARLDAGLPANQWFQIDGPYTREAVQLHTATQYNDFMFN